jgi:hypothetical protein
MKKIGIIVNNKFSSEVIKQINKAKIYGYSILDIQSGKGSNSELSELGDISTSNHVYIVLVCTSVDYAVFKELVVPNIEAMTTHMFAVDIELLQDSLLTDAPDIIC